MMMQKVEYYGEFFVYPVLIAVLSAMALWQAEFGGFAVWLAAFAAGLGIWTLVEYILHRYILHHAPYIKEQHEAHHAEQTALIPTPIWISLGLFAVFVYLPLWLFADGAVAAGITGGLMLGYLAFEGVHHVLHHWKIAPGSHLYVLKRRHMLHHCFDDKGNFGVTTGFWDVVFATDVKLRQSKAAAPGP